ncbi:MAG: EAL domain-containing protein [Candidatus Omnitrophica bacterium]|nr:EAL domain-containing protein [Candidatus Omnitrophota bacterium]
MAGKGAFFNIAEKSSAGIVITDQNKIVRFINQKAEQMFADKGQNLIGKVFRYPLKTGEASEIEILDANGRSAIGEMEVVQIIWEKEPAYFISVRDVSDRKCFESQIEYIARHDLLTHVFNRCYFETQLEQALVRASASKSEMALLCLDIDNFRDINNTCGYQAGDQLIVQLAYLLKKFIKAGDILGRLGGDEFLLLMPNTDFALAKEKALHIIEEIRSHAFTVSTKTVNITISVGVAMSPEHGSTAEELLSHTDIAMYQAKQEGRNRFSFFLPDEKWHLEVESRVEMVKQIRQALTSDKFVLYAQPIKDLTNDKIYRYELLLRMKDEEGKVMLPAHFFTVAEDSGLMPEIDRWVVHQAIEILGRQSSMVENKIQLQFNVSTRSLIMPEFLSFIKNELSTSHVDPSSLVLEIIETAIIPNIYQTQKFIKTIRALGCRVALDNFGARFSSFSYLKYLPVDYFKIEGNFIKRLARSSVNQHLLQNIMEMAKTVKKKTFAERVEDETTLRMVRHYGIDYAQGYHIARPALVSELLGEKKTPRPIYGYGARR